MVLSSGLQGPCGVSGCFLLCNAFPFFCAIDFSVCFPRPCGGLCMGGALACAVRWYLSVCSAWCYFLALSLFHCSLSICTVWSILVNIGKLFTSVYHCLPILTNIDHTVQIDSEQ